MPEVHRIGIAGIKVVVHPDKIRTTLGSCVGIALYDRVAKTGGMAHVMLPTSDGCKGDKGKFADTAVDALLEDAVKAGCQASRLAAKLAGGASMFGPASDNGLGERNIKAVRERLAKHSIRIVAEDVGGVKGRKMLLDPSTGAVEVQIIGCEASTI